MTPIQELRKRFSDFIRRQGCFDHAWDKIADEFRSRGWTAYAFGGTPRGIYDSGNKYRPRDLDLVFDDEHFKSFKSAHNRDILHRNSFGGLKLTIDHLTIDAWPLSSTWAFRNGYVKNPSFDNLPSTTFLNVDGIVVEFAPCHTNERRIFEHGFFEGWESKILDINLKKNPFPSVCVARTLSISQQFGFYISKNLAVYLSEMLDSIALASIERSQVKHYGRIKYGVCELRKIRQKVEEYLSVDSSAPLPLFEIRPTQTDLFISNNIISKLTPKKTIQESTKPIINSNIKLEALFINSLFGLDIDVPAALEKNSLSKDMTKNNVNCLKNHRKSRS
jgi:hypothetical protein